MSAMSECGRTKDALPLEEGFSVVAELEPYGYATDGYCDDGAYASECEYG